MAEEPEEQEEGLQMSFLDHLDELRKRLIYSAIGVSVAFALCFALSDRIFNFLAVPVKAEARKARVARELKLMGKDTREEFAKTLNDGDVVRYTFVLDSYFAGSKVPAGTTVRVKINKKNDRLVASLAEPWILGKTAIAADTEVPEVLGEAAMPPGFDTRDELVINRVAGGFSLYMQVAMYAAVAFAIPFLLYHHAAAAPRRSDPRGSLVAVPAALVGSVAHHMARDQSTPVHRRARWHAAVGRSPSDHAPCRAVVAGPVLDRALQHRLASRPPRGHGRAVAEPATAARRARLRRVGHTRLHLPELSLPLAGAALASRLSLTARR